MKEIMIGNAAVARGLYEAGCEIVSSYPGTPSTEITEMAAKYDEIYCEWAPNEKVATEVAYGASLAGKRSACAMKHVGLNVAADPLFTLSYTGVNGGMVISAGNMLDALQGEQNYAVFTFRERQAAGQTYYLEDTDGGIVAEATPANDFTILVISAPDMTAGDYTLWQGDTQLSGYRGGMGGPSELPEDMTPPEGMEFPENGRPPEMGQGPRFAEGEEPPEKPEGDMPQGGQMPQPDEERPMPGSFNGEIPREASKVFPLTQGGNSFIIL